MKDSERSIVILVTLGSMFEWFEVYLYNYWIPVMSQSFIEFSIPLAELAYAGLILGSGLIARPIGGVIFGYIGDRWGRRTSFLISIIMVTIPSFAIAFMPSFTSWTYASLVYIGLVRFIQGVPAGGELPGALCLLSETADQERRRYLCSYLFVGPQIGQILSMLLCFLLQRHLSHEQLISWGWRLSFGIAGIVGLIGFFLRKKLRESKSFRNLKVEHRIEQNPLIDSFKNQKKNIVIALFLSLFEVTGFFVITFYVFQHSSQILKINESHSLLIYFIYLLSIIFLIPIIGSIKNKYKSYFLLNLSAIGTIILSIPFYIFIEKGLVFGIFFFLTILIPFLCIQFSVLPSFMADLFPTRVRFTCLGFSFSITDGVIGGFIFSLGGWLTKMTGQKASFSLMIPITAVLFLIFLRLVKSKPVQL